MSRDFAIVKPQIWSGKTGRAITRHGKDTRIVADYLVTSPHANLIGLYYLPVHTVAYETGLTQDEVVAALSVLAELDFARYDADAEVIWVLNMARFQMHWRGDGLSKDDKRVKAAQREYREVTDNAFLWVFFEHYSAALHLSVPRGSKRKSPIDGPSIPLARPLDAPPKGSPTFLRDQDQDQDQETLSDQETEGDHDNEKDGEPEGKESFESRIIKLRIRGIAEVLRADAFDSQDDHDREILRRLGNECSGVDAASVLRQVSDALWAKYREAMAAEPEAVQ